MYPLRLHLYCFFPRSIALRRQPGKASTVAAANELARRTLRRLGLQRIGTLQRDYGEDDFDWLAYPALYRGELNALEKTTTTRIEMGQVEFVDGELRLAAGVPPLHPNHRLLYETIGLLAPSSVLEAGCGGGDHLRNLSVLYPELELHGVDRASGQLALLKERNEDIAGRVLEVDLTLPVPGHLARVDVAFTQAVLMHIQTGNGHRVALANLFTIASAQVVLMENWLRHDFWSDVQKLHTSRVIGWPKIHAYIRRAPELHDQPHLLVLSSVPLDLEPLRDYETLVGPLRSRP